MPTNIQCSPQISYVLPKYLPPPNILFTPWPQKGVESSTPQFSTQWGKEVPVRYWSEHSTADTACTGKGKGKGKGWKDMWENGEDT